MLLAIETSCDETAVAVLDRSEFLRNGSETKLFLRADLISSQVKLHQPYGGVVPELAARAHLTNLPPLVDEALRVSGITSDSITEIAVTQGPGLKGCLLVGLSFAKAFSLARRVPLIPVNHLEGHIYAAELLDTKDRPEYPFLALVVSGGHTLLINVKSFRNYETVARTRDDAAGEAFDKIATLLGLPYPGGPALSKSATRGRPGKFTLPLALRNEASSFSFSGLKTAMAHLIKSLGPGALSDETRDDLAYAAEQAIVGQLVEKSIQAMAERRPKSFVLTGGVAANVTLRARLLEETHKRGIRFCAPPNRWCTDNAAMISVLAARIWEHSADDFELWSRNGSRGLLGPAAETTLSVRPRWPVTD